MTTHTPRPSVPANIVDFDSAREAKRRRNIGREARRLMAQALYVDGLTSLAVFLAADRIFAVRPSIPDVEMRIAAYYAAEWIVDGRESSFSLTSAIVTRLARGMGGRERMGRYFDRFLGITTREVSVA